MKGTKFSNPDELDDIIDNSFEPDTKRIFNDISTVYWLKIGSRRDNDSRIGLKMGNLRLDGWDDEFIHSSG